MKLGIGVDIWNQAKLDIPRAQEQLARVQLAERLGYDSVWSAEIYGIDAITPLARPTAISRIAKRRTHSSMRMSARRRSRARFVWPHVGVVSQALRRR